MDNSVLVALISAGGAVIAALIAIIPHLFKKRDHPQISAHHALTNLGGDVPPRPATSTLTERDPVSEEEEEEKEGLEESSGRRRREETIKVLFRHGNIQAGTEIEPMPQALPADGSDYDPKLFRVRLSNPPGRDVVWLKDNKTYTLSKLSNILYEYGLQWFKKRTFELWRIVGEEESLWDKAERLLQEEGNTEHS